MAERIEPSMTPIEPETVEAARRIKRDGTETLWQYKRGSFTEKRWLPDEIEAAVRAEERARLMAELPELYAAQVLEREREIAAEGEVTE